MRYWVVTMHLNGGIDVNPYDSFEIAWTEFEKAKANPPSSAGTIKLLSCTELVSWRRQPK